MGSLHLLVTIPQLLNMKSMILFAVFLAVAAAAPAPQDEKPIILIVNPRTTTPRNKSTLSATRPRTESPSARAVQKQIGDKPEEAGTVSQGKFSYPEGAVTYTITWVADENGFQA